MSFNSCTMVIKLPHTHTHPQKDDAVKNYSHQMITYERIYLLKRKKKEIKEERKIHACLLHVQHKAHTKKGKENEIDPFCGKLCAQPTTKLDS